MENLPVYISVVFGLTTILTVFLFYKATKHSIRTLIVITGWLVLQTFISLTGFYTVTSGIPPRFALLGLPSLILVISLFFTVQGKKYMDSLDAKTLTLLHTIRIPVELVLYWLFLNKAVPELMTFAGRNLDILSGISAPFIFYLGYVKKKMNAYALLFWNLICLGFLINIVINAILSAPIAIQLFAFDQPNIAVMYFPFVWLPCCVVPIVLLSHLAVIRQLFYKIRISKTL